MDTVRIGLLGAGMISQKHLNMYAQIPEAQVVAVCSRCLLYTSGMGLHPREQLPPGISHLRECVLEYIGEL